MSEYKACQVIRNCPVARGKSTNVFCGRPGEQRNACGIARGRPTKLDKARRPTGSSPTRLCKRRRVPCSGPMELCDSFQAAGGCHNDLGNACEPTCGNETDNNLIEMKENIMTRNRSAEV